MFAPRSGSRLPPLVLASLVLTSFGSTALADERATPAAGGPPAEVIVHVPPDAVVWFDGVRMRQTGVERRFVTPPVAAGRRFGYDVRASWIVGGRAVEHQRHVSFRAGDRIVLDFTPAARLNPPQDILIDPAAPAPWRMGYYYDPFNWPNYPSLRPGRPFSPLPPTNRR